MRNLSLQEKLWSSKFGDDYIERNRHELRIAHWKKIFNKAHIEDDFSFLEFGANIGVNLDSIKQIYNNVKCTGIEINKNAFLELSSKHKAINCSILDFKNSNQYDFVFTFVCLIHINPNQLNDIYKKIYNISNKYILIAEYFNPIPVVVKYREQENALFKRDFAGDILDLYPNLEIVDYGFFWKRDPNCKEDNINWFLFKKG